MEGLNKNVEKYLPFLEDLRGRLFTGVIVFIIFFAIGFFSAGMILKGILSFVDLDQVTIVTSSPFQFIDVAMDLGFFLAIMVCIPYTIYSLYSFVMPALSKKERREVLRSIPTSLLLFVFGFFYGFAILYYALGLLSAINTRLGIANFWNISQFLSEMFITAALLGAIFEYPIVLTIFIKIGVINPQSLKDKRRVAYFIMFIFVSLLPPTDGISLVAMTLPLMILYEVTILLNNNKKNAGTRG